MKLNRPIVFFDVETTGVNITNDRIIEIGMIKIHPDFSRENYSKRINPEGKEISENAFGKHGIKLEDLEDCPKFSEVANEIKDFIEGCDLGGYNCKKFDIPILLEEFLRCDVKVNVKDFNIVDIYRILMKEESRKLEDVYKRFVGKSLKNAHSADADIYATIEILEKFEEKFDIPETPEEIHKYTFEDDNTIDFEGKLKKNEKGEIVFNFGKYKDRTMREVFEMDRGYYDWLMKIDMGKYTKIIFQNIINFLDTEKK